MFDFAAEKMAEINKMIEKLVGDRFGTSRVNFPSIFGQELDYRYSLSRPDMGQSFSTVSS